ncbi:MAG: hypothetical protein IIA61_05700 [Candidatus Marinimicrobia bacterium]|nr:hypothetical protein [Candidatus Neomarinimicrobiota bacterium]
MICLIFSGAISFNFVFAQRIVDWNKGNHNYTKKGIMDGNLVETVYYNFGQIADWLNEPSRSGVWPKGTNHTYVDGVAIIVQAEAEDPQGNIIHPLETNYYEYTRFDPSTGVTYGWWPLPGYSDPFQSSPAQSGRPETWPDHWPDRPADWDGIWNGFFGKGVENADLETYFVFDDNEDRQYIINNKYYPDSEDTTRGGLGMQVRARGFQWSQVLAEDVIFWYYEITNMSTTDYEKTLFAQYVDWGIGGHDNSSNNAGNFDVLLDISYAWSTVSFGSPGHWSPVGMAAYAFLESPGKSYDFKDNDQDGLWDERRDNEAAVFIENPSDDPFLVDVFQDTLNFKNFYGYSWKPHWDADENANWRTYFDIDENGKWDEGEPLYDDVGTDGIGPFDDDYNGPDLDGSEANGMPDQGEPNFGILDKDESDQLGLTGFIIFPTHNPYDLDNDEENWGALSALPTPVPQELIGVNLANFFSCYLFQLNGRNTYGQETGETERFSMALIFGIDKDDIFRRKRTVQQIYNANYRFAKPPDKPIIKAIPGDRRVTLYWDDRAEKTWDAFYQRYNFEGYRIYRSTEPNFLENKLITDAYGKATFRKPIAQFDLIDGIKGLHPIDVNGALFDLGNDSGLKHSYIDSTVNNGQTYYYAVVAYDQGFTTTTIEGEFLGIPPSETSSTIKKKITGELETDINTAIVTPRAPAAGYIPPEIENVQHIGPGTGRVTINILDPDSLKDNHTYRLEFEDFSAFHDNSNPSYRLIDFSVGDTLIELTTLTGINEQTPVLDGFAIDIENDPSVVIDYDRTGWETGNSNYIVQVGFDERFANAYKSKRVNYPADFEITFTTVALGDTSFPSTPFSQPQPSNITIRNVTEGTDNIQFIFRDIAEDSIFNVTNPNPDDIDGDAIFIVYGDSAGKSATSFSDLRVSWSVTFKRDSTIADSLQQPPEIGDIFFVATKKPFRTGEYYEFVIRAPAFDKSKAKSDLDDIAVIPNPYVGAASWEPQTSSVGRGERRIYFIHLPQKCTIRIYTISGHLVKILEHDSTISDGQELWNLVSRDGMNVAYGIYVYHVDAPGIGEKIGRFALIK